MDYESGANLTGIKIGLFTGIGISSALFQKIIKSNLLIFVVRSL